MPSAVPEEGDEEDDGRGINLNLLHKELDQMGPFMRTETGCLDLLSIVTFKEVVMRNTHRGHKARKKELQAERIRLLRAERMEEYSQLSGKTN